VNHSHPWFALGGVNFRIWLCCSSVSLDLSGPPFADWKVNNRMTAETKFQGFRAGPVTRGVVGLL
jgi:hypothetical protein